MIERPKSNSHDSRGTRTVAIILGMLAGQDRTRRRRRFQLQASAKAAVVLVSGGAGMVLAWRWLQPREPVYAGIACSRVLELGPAYMMGKLDAALSQQVQQHLAECVACRQLYDSMSMQTSALAGRHGTVESCACRACRHGHVVAALASFPPIG